MTIRFAQFKDFRIALEAVKTAQVGEALSANNCVRINQPQPQLTELVGIELNRAVFCQLITHAEADSWGDPNTTFLVEQNELFQKTTRLSNSKPISLTIHLRGGKLTFAADLSVVNGSRRERGSLSVRQYPGSVSDFGPVIKADHLVAQVDGSKFREWVTATAEFGDFSAEKFQGNAVGRTVLVQLKDGKLQAMSNYKGAYMAYIRTELDATVEEEQRFAIEGRHFRRLKSITDGSAPVEILFYEENERQWVTFSSNKGYVSLLRLEPEQRFLMNYSLFDDHPRVVKEGVRCLATKDLLSAIEMQMPAQTDAQQDLVLVEHNGSILILQASNINDRAYVDIDPINLVGNWAGVCANSKALKRAVMSVLSYLLRSSVQTGSIVMTLRYVTKQNGSKTYILNLDPGGYEPPLTVNLVILVKPLEDNLDIDADE